MSRRAEQDKLYWNDTFSICDTSDGAEESEIFTAWVALEDVGPESGPLQLIRGSHLWANGLLQLPLLFFHQDFVEQQGMALESIGLTDEDWQPVGPNLLCTDPLDSQSPLSPGRSADGPLVGGQVPAVLPAGGVSVHDWRTLHGSGPNHGTSMRKSLAIHFRTGRSWPRPAGYLDTFLHDRRRHCCPVVLGDPLAIKGDQGLPLVFEEAGPKL